MRCETDLVKPEASEEAKIIATMVAKELVAMRFPSHVNIEVLDDCPQGPRHIVVIYVPVGCVNKWLRTKEKKRKQVMALEHRLDVVLWLRAQCELVPAELGDLVRIFHEDAFFGLKSNLGIVTSRKTLPSGKEVYGCRYLIPKFGRGHGQSADDRAFEVTDEDYGGYHDGFIEVLSQRLVAKELRDMCLEAAKKVYKKQIARSKLVPEDLAKMVERLTKHRVATIEVTDDKRFFDENDA